MAKIMYFPIIDYFDSERTLNNYGKVIVHDMVLENPLDKLYGN